MPLLDQQLGSLAECHAHPVKIERMANWPWLGRTHIAGCLRAAAASATVAAGAAAAAAAAGWS